MWISNSTKTNMEIQLWTLGKLRESYIEEGCQIYEKRLKHYCKYSIHVLKTDKIKHGQKVANFKKQEAMALLKKINTVNA